NPGIRTAHGKRAGEHDFHRAGITRAACVARDLPAPGHDEVAALDADPARVARALALRLNLPVVHDLHPRCGEEDFAGIRGSECVRDDAARLSARARAGDEDALARFDAHVPALPRRTRTRRAADLATAQHLERP